MNVAEVFNYRYACKEFDTSKKVEQKILDDILLAARLSPSSFGLEPWRFVVIKSEQKKQELMQASYYQKQVQECDFVIAVVARLDFTQDDKYIDECASRLSENVDKYAQVCRGFFKNKNLDDITSWAENQCFIASANMMSVAAYFKVDSCAIGGFEPSKVAKILDLNSKEKVSLLIPFGYRKDDTSLREKIRWQEDKIISYM